MRKSSMMLFVAVGGTFGVIAGCDPAAEQGAENVGVTSQAITIDDLVITEVYQGSSATTPRNDQVEVYCSLATGSCPAFMVGDSTGTPTPANPAGSGWVWSAVQPALGAGQRAVISRSTNITTTDYIILGDASYYYPSTQVGPVNCTSGTSMRRNDCASASFGSCGTHSLGSASGPPCGQAATCSSVGATCGTINDGTLNCGTCATGHTCTNNKCGAGTSPVPAACAHDLACTGNALTSGCEGVAPAPLAGCVASICAADSFCCSTAWDSICVGEVKTICGVTTPANPGQCAIYASRTPAVCLSLSATCGSVSDRNGGTVNCGTCPSGQTCGGGGTANQCGVPSQSGCTAGGVECALQAKRLDYNTSDACVKDVCYNTSGWSGPTTNYPPHPGCCDNTPGFTTPMQPSWNSLCLADVATAQAFATSPCHTCKPLTCTDVVGSCGTGMPDGCGGTVNCSGSTCPTGQTCSNNQCTPNSCTPTTCAAQGKSCGSIPNGCGSTLSCGTCSGATCIDNVCVNVGSCIAQTCGGAGAQCGSIPDGCGNQLNCGACTGGKTCTSNNVCTSAASTLPAPTMAVMDIGSQTFSFGMMGDTRPAVSGATGTASYPTTIINSIFKGVQAKGARFAVSAGDYGFAGTAGGAEGKKQFDIYMAARSKFTGTFLPAMGNHECSTATVGNCAGNPTGLFNDYMSTIVTPSTGLATHTPYYSMLVTGTFGTAKIVIVAANSWDATQATWLTNTLAVSTTYTFVVRHTPRNSNMVDHKDAPGTIPSEDIMALYPLTLSITGHTHNVQLPIGQTGDPSATGKMPYGAYGGGAPTLPKEVIIGNGGAPLGAGPNYGYAIATRASDGRIVVQLWASADSSGNEITNVKDTNFLFAVNPSGTKNTTTTLP